MTFLINGITISRMTKPDWQDSPGDSQSLYGAAPTARWRRLVCPAEALTATEWDTLRALEGQRVSVTAPPYADRNAASWVTYYGAIFDRLTGSHEGPIHLSVTAEFMVRV